MSKGRIAAVAVVSVAGLLLVMFWPEMAFSIAVIAALAAAVVAAFGVPGPFSGSDEDGVRPVGGDDAEPGPWLDSVPTHECSSLYMDEGGTYPGGVPTGEWVGTRHPHRDAYGVAPTYDPRRVYIVDDEDYVLAAMGSGVRMYSCEYMLGDTCLVPECRRWLCPTYSGHAGIEGPR